MRKIKQAKHGPEHKIQQDIVEFLECRGWHVERIVGGMYQSGLPDLYIGHPKWGSRWLEVKNPNRYSFTRQQKHKFPVFEKYRIGIWILTAATQKEYDKLFGPPNWRDYVKKSWNIPTIEEIDKMMEEI